MTRAPRSTALPPEEPLYRANADGTVRRVADLKLGDDNIAGVVDVNGDGQPELIGSSAASCLSR